MRPIAVVSEEVAKDTCVPRQPLMDGEENACAICMDEMTTEQALTWCRVGCGQNIHAKCMMKCAQHNLTDKKPTTCPLCRNLLDLFTIKLDLKGKSSLKHSYAPVQCISCKCNLRGDFFRCVECSQIAVQGSEKPLDYCPECFERQTDPVHIRHHFVQSNIVTENAYGVDWVPAKNPATKGVLMNPELIRELQTRELGDHDYDMLLQLTNGGPVPDFPVLCVESLPVYTRSKSSKKAGGAHSMCWCAKALSPSRSPSQIIVHSPLTGAAELSTLELVGGSGSHSPQRDNRPMRVLPCKHVAHDRCLKDKVSMLVADDTEEITRCRCAHVDCGLKIFIGLSRRRKSNKKPSAETKKEGGKEEAAGLGAAMNDITSGIVGAGCFGSTGGMAGVLRVNRNLHRRGRNSYTSDESGSSAAPSMDFSVSSNSMQSSSVGGNSWEGRAERSAAQQAPAPAPRLANRSNSLNTSRAVPDNLSFEVNAVGMAAPMPQQAPYAARTGAFGVARNKPPVGRRVRLGALGHAAAGVKLGGTAPHSGFHSSVGAEAYSDTVQSGATTAFDPTPQFCTSARRDLANEFEQLDVGSYSDRAPSPAPLPAIRPVQRSSSMGSSSHFQTAGTRSAEVKANVSNVLVYNLKQSRQKNRPREPVHSADHSLVMEVMSLSNPGTVILPSQHSGAAGSHNTQRPAGGRIIRGGLRNSNLSNGPSPVEDHALQGAMLSNGLAHSRNSSHNSSVPDL